MVLSDNGKTSRYTYNAAGERIMKSYGTMEGVYINGAPQGITFHETDNFTLYPASILSVNKNRFTKHYFIGDKRVASRIGTGLFNNVYGRNGSYVTDGQQDYAERMNQIQTQKEAYYKKVGVAPGVPTEKGAYGDPENTGVGYNAVLTELGNHDVPRGWIQTPMPNTTPNTNPGPPVSWNDPSNPDDPQAGYGYIPNDTTKEETFFYHSDHLGSTSYITDDKVNITQYDAYLPYGELLVDEHSSSEELPYKFNGKQFDEETGLYYYGARYLNPITSLWYGVDRFKEKYPHLSSFNACASTPLLFRDLNGDSLWIVNKQTNILYEDHKLYNKDGSLYSGKVEGFVKEAKEAIDIISGTDSGSNVLEEFQKSKKNIYIHKFYKENYFTPWGTRASLLMVPSNSKYSSIAGAGGNIYWDPYNTEGGPDEFRNTERPAFIGLAHEMGHAYAALKGKADYNYFSPKAMPPLNRIHRDDYNAMHFENMIRYELGYPLRIAYTYDEKGDLFFNYNYENR